MTYYAYYGCSKAAKSILYGLKAWDLSGKHFFSIGTRFAL